MRVRTKRPLLIPAALLLSLGLVGCETATAPEGLSKPKGVQPQVPVDPQPTHGNGNGNGRGNGRTESHSVRGAFKKFSPVWVVSHFTEQGCAGLQAGAEVRSTGTVTHLGLTQVTASAAWDWGVRPSGLYAPQGPTTGPSATLVTSYPHSFCSAPQTATGDVVLVAADGDELHGVVAGGEVYELGFDGAGDGQEQFMAVEVTGGTGRFAAASGSFVIHSIFDLAGGTIVKSEILRGGTLNY